MGPEVEHEGQEGEEGDSMVSGLSDQGWWCHSLKEGEGGRGVHVQVF